MQKRVSQTIDISANRGIRNRDREGKGSDPGQGSLGEFARIVRRMSSSVGKKRTESQEGRGRPSVDEVTRIRRKRNDHRREDSKQASLAGQCKMFRRQGQEIPLDHQQETYTSGLNGFMSTKG
jgi:hypothetical protein